MMQFAKETVYYGFAKRITFIFLFFFVTQLLLGSVLIYQVSLKQTADSLQQTAARVKEDVSYRNGKWDISRYNADPEVPDTYPLYLLSTDGFVIDRWKPLHGYLDTSDVKRLLSYEAPQTITTPTNQTWRIFSKPILHDGQTLGVVTVSYFNPSADGVAAIDQSLYDAATVLVSKIIVKNDTVTAHNVDPRDIPFNIAFQVVDNFNQIVTKNNNTNSIDRIPNYIDPSYVGGAINQSPSREVKDAVSGEQFLLVTTPIVDQNNYVVGVLVVGKSIAYISQVTRNFIVAECTLGFVLVVGSIIVALRILHPIIEQAKQHTEANEKKSVQHITFEKKTGNLMLDQEMMAIPYATNQYYLCEAVFAHPKKRWEVDELLERFGERDLTNARKVYDAMVTVNKKAASILDDRLIVVREKTYSLNPRLLEKLI